MNVKSKATVLLLLCLSLCMVVPTHVFAATKNTKTTYYLYNTKRCIAYKSQTTLVVKSVTSKTADYSKYVPRMKNIKKIVISNNVKTLPANFFSKYPNVQELQLPKTFKGTNAFPELRNNVKLSKIKVTSGNKYMKVKNGVLYSANMEQVLVYPNAKKDATYNMPSTVTSAQTCFGCNTFLTKLILSQNLESMIVDDQKYLPSLTDIEVPSDNQTMTSSDGVLFNNKTNSIMYWPKAKPYTELHYPDSFNTISIRLWNDFEKIETLYIGANVTTINGIYSKNQLKNIVLDQDNNSFHLEDGVLYNADYSKIVIYPNKNTITAIHLNDNLTKLNANDFGAENTTTELILPANLTTDTFDSMWDILDISEIPFRNFTSLQKVTISPENKNFTSLDNVLYSADQSKLLWYPIDRLETEYTLPEKVTSLIYQLCITKNLKQIHLNSTVQHANYIGFCSPDLEAITVDSDNTKYASKDGVLYNKDMTHLYVYPMGKTDETFSMPDTVTNADFYWKNDSLKKLTLSKNLTMLNVYFSNSYQEGYAYAFEDYDNLESIMFNGNSYSKEDLWNLEWS